MQMIKVGSIIEILNHDAMFDYPKPSLDFYLERYPIGSKHVVLRWHPETGEVELSYDQDPYDGNWHTFFPGEYKLVE